MLLWPAAAEAEGAALTEAVTFTEALRTTVLYRTDYSVLGVGFVTIMTASSVIILCSATPGPGITTRTISGLNLRAKPACGAHNWNVSSKRHVKPVALVGSVTRDHLVDESTHLKPR